MNPFCEGSLGPPRARQVKTCTGGGSDKTRQPGRGWPPSRAKQTLAQVDRLIICVFLEKDESIYLQRLPHYFPAGE